MLPNTVKERKLEFDTPAGALQHLNSRGERRHLLQTQNLSINSEGFLSYSNTGFSLEDIPLTETALQQVNSIVGITESYSNKIEPKLHAHSINELFRSLDASVTVVVSYDQENSDNKHICAILPGDRSGVHHSIILQRLEFWGLPSQISLKGGQMEVQFGTPKILEVLPEDYVEITGRLTNVRWNNRASTRPLLESSLFWKRLVCSNGAYLQRVLGKGRLMNLASSKEVGNFVDLQLKRIDKFEKEQLIPAVKTMKNTMPEEEEYNRIQKMITRSIGEEKASELLNIAVSYWDEFNAITEAAHHTTNENKIRNLWITGGVMLERFLAK